METTIDKLIKKPINTLSIDQLRFVISHYEGYSYGYTGILKVLQHELIKRLENEVMILSYENNELKERNLQSIKSFIAISNIISNNYLS